MMYLTLFWLWLCGYGIGHYQAGDPVPQDMVALAQCVVPGEWTFGVETWTASTKSRVVVYGDVSSNSGIVILGSAGCHVDQNVWVLRYKGMTNVLTDGRPSI